jgi:orotidine-5'-phosphate decarboxylase
VEQWAFGVLDAIHGIIPVVKPQAAFFEQLGPPGVETLTKVIAKAKEMGFITILDAKRGDIGSTAQAYVEATLSNGGPMKADSVTLSPYLGPESLQPYKDYVSQAVEKGAWVLVRTSNPGARAWQGTPISGVSKDIALWIKEANAGHSFGSFGAVIGATIDPTEMAQWREMLWNTWFLLPGYGEQGAKAMNCKPGLRPDGLGGLIVSARGVLFPSSAEGWGWQEGVHRRAREFADDVGSILS